MRLQLQLEQEAPVFPISNLVGTNLEYQWNGATIVVEVVLLHVELDPHTGRPERIHIVMCDYHGTFYTDNLTFHYLATIRRSSAALSPNNSPEAHRAHS